MMPECVWPGCSRAIEPHQFLCGEHWKATPFDERRAMRGSWEGGVALEDQPLAFKRAYQVFEQWIRATFTGSPDKHDPGRWERLKRVVRERDEARKRREDSDAK